MKKLFIILLLLLIPSISLSIDKTRCELIQAQVELELKRNAKYTLGANKPKMGDEADCTSYIARIVNNADLDAATKKLRISGYPVRRSTTNRILLKKGLEGWKGIWYTYEDSKKCFFPFFDFKVKGGYKHTGIFRRDVVDGITILSHASSTYGIIQIPMRKSYKDPFYAHFLESLDLE